MGLKIIQVIKVFVWRGFKAGDAVCETMSIEQFKEMIPDLIHGYLSPEEMPNSLKLLPSPPKSGSKAFKRDLASAKNAVESTDKVRFILANADADLSFPAVVRSFENSLGIEISESKTPKIYVFMRRVMTDVGLSTYALKNYYNRERPFVVNRCKTCTPEKEDVMRGSSSFPSAHAALGWAWALLFSRMLPEKEKIILERGYEFGESRIICNVHWRSDVEMGRVMGEATVKRLLVNSGFQIDFDAVKDEVYSVLKG